MLVCFSCRPSCCGVISCDVLCTGGMPISCTAQRAQQTYTLSAQQGRASTPMSCGLAAKAHDPCVSVRYASNACRLPQAAVHTWVHRFVHPVVLEERFCTLHTLRVR